MLKAKILPSLNLRLFVIILLFFSSCKHNDDEPAITYKNINNFIWKGLNSWYYWQEDIPNLADGLDTQPSYLDLVNTPSNSWSFFYSFINSNPESDRFSWITSDYNQLNNAFRGSVTSFGFEFGLALIDPNQEAVFGYVKYVLPNSLAQEEGIQRGDFFTSVNDIPLNLNNFIDLIYGNSNFEIQLSDYVNGEFIPTGTTKRVQQEVITENPVYYTNTYSSNDRKVGYLVYNGFTFTFNEALNEAFAYFQSENITDLILDLRYNSGGSVETAAYLASMILGENGGEIFAELRYNEKHSADNKNFHFTRDMNVYNLNGQEAGITSINSVNINTITVITSGQTASASELLINGLLPFIPLTQIGTKTVGKNVGSITLYDCPIYDFISFQYANKSHTWAMQPIVFKTYNSLGESNYANGFEPSIPLNEVQHLDNFPSLGDSTEPLLAAALAQYGIGRPGVNQLKSKSQKINNITFPSPIKILENEMYLIPSE